ncbi:GntR family transcriptional regulator of gluconate operon [Paenibacillus anaericanus]|uniref:GntR family transcriptional regulator n=1 Tax=Paenibacillus anaericanus TaxID=170367 RepID=UPI00278B3BCE|nr:GntR family transcriptional regulator [Paenibacillus anaericanus]MDQ0091906.1 GntR family transcriptional regulator of gluconate operon [Paenibacillus anaericanus]
MQYPAAWLKGSTLGESIASKLRLQIINREIKPGEILSENRIAADFGASRSPVREALKILAAEGLISLQRMGVHVNGLSLNNIEELYDVRFLIENFAWQRMAASDSAARITMLNQIIDKMDLAAKHNDFVEFAYQDFCFHEYIIKETKHTRILHLWTSISQIVITLKLITTKKIFSQQKKHIQSVIQQHQKLLECLQFRDTAIIQARVEEYFADSRRTLQTSLL